MIWLTYLGNCWVQPSQSLKSVHLIVNWIKIISGLFDLSDVLKEKVLQIKLILFSTINKVIVWALEVKLLI